MNNVYACSRLIYRFSISVLSCTEQLNDLSTLYKNQMQSLGTRGQEETGVSADMSSLFETPKIQQQNERA
jgi:hypothetical protein